MDPNACVKLINDLSLDIEDRECSLGDLEAWLRFGGFLPTAKISRRSMLEMNQGERSSAAAINTRILDREIAENGGF